MSTPYIYLIDDDEDDREIFAMALEKAAPLAVYNGAANGYDALVTLAHNTVPNYIFIDLNMPRMSGRECLSEIKKHPRLKNVPAIMYTTSSLQNDAEALKELGASHFIVKPRSLGTLTGILKQLLSGNELPYFINTPV